MNSRHVSSLTYTDWHYLLCLFSLSEMSAEEAEAQISGLSVEDEQPPPEYLQEGEEEIHGDAEEIEKPSDEVISKALSVKEAFGETPGDDESEGFAPRTMLPCGTPPPRKLNIWTLLKDAIGKDITRITLPCSFNEPLSFLQHCCEETLEYIDLLERAADKEDSMERLLHFTLWAIAGYTSSLDRLTKPFNPLLGETYEYLGKGGADSNKKYRYFAEQVSHHPPTSAFFASSQDGQVEYWGDITLKNKFWGKSVEVYPRGYCYARLKGPRDDIFSLTKGTAVVHNVIVGKMWMEYVGKPEILNTKTGEKALLELKNAGWMDKRRHLIFAEIVGADGFVKYRLRGKWSESVYLEVVEGEVLPDKLGKKEKWEDVEDNGKYQKLWSRHSDSCAKDNYNYPDFTIGLNEIRPKQKEFLPPTDCRYRPDQRKLEDGDFKAATKLKLALEEKQRAAKKRREKAKEQYVPRWFTKAGQGDSGWIYEGKYWDVREKKEWAKMELPDIYLEEQ
uniref:Oxysterol-binding protein n=1 Tax=Palpitomonas bilix TaxID=652834 RepID=A0A7S3D687_9EUKA